MFIPPVGAHSPMAIQIVGLALAFLLPVIGGVVWLVRLEGKVNVQEERVDALKELILSEFRRSDADINRRLERIERSMNGHLLKE